jgi:DNA mismatch repair ATPase MutS
MPPLFALFFLNLGVIGVTLRRTNAARDKILLFGPLLDGIHRLDGWLATGNLRSEHLVAAARAVQDERPTNRKLRRAVRLLELHTQGMAFEVFNILTLWELRFVPLTERLLLGKKAEIRGALLALTDLEALASLACPMAEQSDFILPTATFADRPCISGNGVGHPLIEANRVVRNPVEIGSETVTLVVTGSNMAGKSTYLKAVAINVLLAQAGGPVCAQSFRWTPVELYSDLNVRDSLDDGKSYFQVEVERVADVLRASKRTPFVLAILDELFRGTNSDERLALSRAILRHLRDTGALAIVATHDNALTHLAERDAESGMRNVHFEETVTDAAMTFDYALREGPARTRNAIRVLEITGYPEEIIRRARSEAGEDVR